MKKEMSLLSSIYTYAIVFIMVLTLQSCEKNEIDPLLGNIVVEVKRENLKGVGYRVYSEAYLSSNSSFPHLISGTISGDKIEINGINPRNYILELEAGHNWRIFLQATAGQVRRFEIN
jgi:hypothetical protein